MTGPLRLVGLEVDPEKQTEEELQIKPLPVVMPLEVEMVNKLAQAAARPGETFFPNYQMAIAVPAGGTVEFVYYMPSHFV